MNTNTSIDNVKKYINDNFPELQNYKLLVNLIPLVLIVYLYYIGDINLYTKFFKITAIILFIRLILNNTTEIIINNEKYSQLNVSLIVFIICILLLLNKGDINKYSSIAIISIYLILQSLNTLTTDNILTSILVLVLFEQLNSDKIF